MEQYCKQNKTKQKRATTEENLRVGKLLPNEREGQKDIRTHRRYVIFIFKPKA